MDTPTEAFAVSESNIRTIKSRIILAAKLFALLTIVAEEKQATIWITNNRAFDDALDKFRYRIGV